MSAEARTVMTVEGAGRVLHETLEIVDLGGRVERNPYGMMAGAIGIGFVLGGGLFTQLTAKILGTGLRIGLMAALPILQEKLVQANNGSRFETDKGE